MQLIYPAHTVRDWFNWENVGDVPGSIALMRLALKGLVERYPDAEFSIFSTETFVPSHADLEEVVQTVPGSIDQILWNWDSLEEGRGGITECSFLTGVGLRLDVGGSEGLSATSIYVVPVRR